MRNVLIIFLLLVAGAGGWLLGNQSAQLAKSKTNQEDIQTPVVIPGPKVIRGIGKLEPASGIFKVFAPQGERIDSLYGLKVGQRVTAGQPIVKLASLKIRELELAIARAREKDAERQLEFETSKARKKKQGAELAVAEAASIGEQVIVQSKSITLLRTQLVAARRQLNRFENLKSNRLTSTMVGQTDLEKQRLLIAQLESKITAAEADVQIAIEKAERAEQAAQLELAAAELMIRDAGLAVPKKSLESAIAAALKAVELSEIKSPVSGDVIDIIVRPGDTAINQPVVLIGDTDAMVCVAEINDVNFRFVKLGDKAVISSVALASSIEGTVDSLGVMIGPPSMKDPNPFAGVDRKTGRVVIKLEDSEAAKKFVNLQVDVEIELGEANEP